MTEDMRYKGFCPASTSGLAETPPKVLVEDRSWKGEEIQGATDKVYFLTFVLIYFLTNCYRQAVDGRRSMRRE